MPSEVWGYRVGDYVEIYDAERWAPAKVISFDVNRNIWVRTKGSLARKVPTPRHIRRLQLPDSPDGINEWLEG